MRTPMMTPVDDGLSAPLTATRLCQWLARAPRGERLVYHEGLLIRDRTQPGSLLPAKERDRLNTVATLVWRAGELGLVQLFSQKRADGAYRYLAVRTSLAMRLKDVRASLRVANAEQQPEVA